MGAKILRPASTASITFLNRSLFEKIKERKFLYENSFVMKILSSYKKRRLEGSVTTVKGKKRAPSVPFWHSALKKKIREAHSSGHIPYHLQLKNERKSGSRSNCDVFCHLCTGRRRVYGGCRNAKKARQARTGTNLERVCQSR